jgi:sulfur relay (sulfurtransferase) DsrC/TusE family protein
MKLSEYKQAIRLLVDATNNEMLLKHWQKQLAWDIEHQNEIELSTEEWNLVQEGIADYENGEVISLEDFINKRK